MEIVFKHHDEFMNVDEEWFIKRYKEWCKDENLSNRKSEETMKGFVRDYLTGLDDCYYYCDNYDEITQQLLSILTQAGIKNVKVVEVEVDE